MMMFVKAAAVATIALGIAMAHPGDPRFSAHGTHFDGMGTPFGGCGVPPELAVDEAGTPLPFVALNTNSEFDNGANCGRWVEITLKENCVGAGNTAFSICDGGSFEADDFTGDVIYGYVMDSCADDNFWCQDDTYHLDISRSYLAGMDLVGSNFNGRKLEWQYMHGTPPGWVQSHPKFALKDGSKWFTSGTFWATAIISNVANGIGVVEQKVGDTYVPLSPLVHLGNMYVLTRPDNAKNGNGGAGQTITLRVFDIEGNMYGEYAMDWVCGTEECDAWTEAPASVVVEGPK